MSDTSAQIAPQALPAGLTVPEVLRLYEQMLLLRRFELAAQVACRKGETPGFFAPLHRPGSLWRRGLCASA